MVWMSRHHHLGNVRMWSDFFPGNLVCAQCTGPHSLLLGKINEAKYFKVFQRYVLEHGPYTHDFCLCSFESTARLSRSCNCMALPFTEGCTREIYFTYPIFVRKQPKPSWCLWPSFTRVHREFWCSSGFLPSTFSIHICHLVGYGNDPILTWEYWHWYLLKRERVWSLNEDPIKL